MSYTPAGGGEYATWDDETSGGTSWAPPPPPPPPPVEEIDLENNNPSSGKASMGQSGHDDGQSSWLQSLAKSVPALQPVANTISSINLPFIDSLLQHINRDLLVSKMFYFFFYSAFGSLFPLMGVYFKQLGMNPMQLGILTGIRPFIEIFSAPFWNSLAERFNKSKALLMFSLMSWIVFTYSLAHIRPPASACVAFNDTDYVLYIPYSSDDLSYPDTKSDAELSMSESNTEISEQLESSPSSSSTEASVVSAAARKRRFVDDDSLNILQDLENDFDDDLDPTRREMDMGGQNRLRRRYRRHWQDQAYEVGQDQGSDQGGEDQDSYTARIETDTDEPNMEPATSGQTPDETQQPKSITTEAPATTTTTIAPPTTESSGETSTEMTKKKRKFKQRHKAPPTHKVGMSPISVEYTANYDAEKHSSFVTPPFSTIVYKIDDIKEVFFLLLLLIGLGEFFSAPAITLADSATLGYLGDNTDLYGRQRMFGSFGWAVTLLFVGMALDNATSIPDHPCGPHERERSYTVCFTIFSLLMACALMTATQFRFSYSAGSATTAVEGNATVVSIGGAQASDDQFPGPRSIFNNAPPINAPPTSKDKSGEHKFEFLDRWKSAVFAQRTRELPQWVNVFKQFRNPLHMMYLFITWFLGCGVGLVFTFLFWHLQDVGGTPTLFGLCSVINHISEILAYFFSFHFIKRFGYSKVLSFGLGCNVVRFIYVAFSNNPFYALPFEMVQGITHGACFAACCSYISHVSKPELRSSTQGVMQGLHHGIGRACGALIGGWFINSFGSRAGFCVYGILSGAVLAGFTHIRRKASQGMYDEELDKVDESDLGGFGAPQGVPTTAPIKMQYNSSNTTVNSNINQDFNQGAQYQYSTSDSYNAAPSNAGFAQQQQQQQPNPYDINAAWED